MGERRPGALYSSPTLEDWDGRQNRLTEDQRTRLAASIDRIRTITIGAAPRVKRLKELLQVEPLPARSYPARKSRRRRQLEAFVRAERGRANVVDIIAATSANGFRPPEWINHRRLREDIRSAKLNATILQDLGNAGAWKNYHKRMGQIHRAAHHLIELLERGDEGRRCSGWLMSGFPLVEGAPRENSSEDGIETRTFEASPSFLGLMAGLTRLRRAAERKLSGDLLSGSAPLPPRERGFAEGLMRDGLKPVFEKWFGEKASIGRSLPNDDPDAIDEVANSPYTLFVLAVFDDLGILNQSGRPYRPETVVREAARKKPRRKKTSAAPAGQF